MSTTPANRVRRSAYLIPLLLGLVPLLWFKPGFQLASEDMDILFDARHWWPLWHSWNPQPNTGLNYSFALASQGFHALPVILHGIGFTTPLAQRMQSVVWFTLQGLGITYLMVRVVKPSRPIVATAVAVSFYLFNLYQEEIWMSMDTAKISASAMLPVLIAQCLLLIEGRVSLRRATAVIAGVSLLGAGIGLNPPVLVVTATAVLLVVMTTWLVRFRELGWSGIGRSCRHLLVVTLVLLACHAFWILPLLSRVQQDIPAGGQALSLDWLNGISTNTTFDHVVRLQGNWTWYQGWKEPYRPYAAVYQHQPAFLVLSWVVPVVVILGLLRARTRYKLPLFVLTGCGLILSMGVHPPMAPLYQWLTRHIPLFWTIRSPWQKFSLWTCIGYAVFLGLAANVLIDGLQRWTKPRSRVLALAVTAMLMAVNLVYAFPVTLGKMYVAPEERRFLPPNHMRIPDYAWETSRWLDQRAAREFFRVLVLPESEAFTYSWGCASHAPLLLHLGMTSVVYPIWPTGTTAEQPLVRTIYRGLYQGTPGTLSRLLPLLNVRYLVHQTDLQYWVPRGDADGPAFIRGTLAHQEGVRRGPTFGAWDLYEVAPPLPHLYHIPAATLVIGDVPNFLALTRTAWLTPAMVMTAGTPGHLIARLAQGGAFDRVVIGIGNAPLPPALAAPPIMLVASTDQLVKRVDPDQAHPMTPWQGFGPAVTEVSGGIWWPLVSNSAPNWTFTNPTREPLVLYLAGTVRSPQHPRSLYAYLDQQLLAIHQIPSETPTGVAMTLTLAPGTHTLGWYSPDARTQLADGQQVGFYFSEDWRVGPAAQQGTWCVPRAGLYRVRVLSDAGHDLPNGLTLRLGETEVPLARDPAHAEERQATTTVAGGPVTLTLRGAGGTPVTILLTPAGQPVPAVYPAAPYSPITQTPTAYQLPPLPGPGWVVFSEAYNPGWVFTGNRDVIHLPINGFANGYFVATPVAGSAALRFAPQQWMVAGGLISLSAIAVLILLSLRWRKATPHAE